MKPLERKAVIIARIIAAIDEYMAVYGKPIPMKALASRFGKALGDMGGFPETLDELRRDGTIQIVLLPTGGKKVYPAESTIPEGEKKTG